MCVDSTYFPYLNSCFKQFCMCEFVLYKIVHVKLYKKQILQTQINVDKVICTNSYIQNPKKGLSICHHFEFNYSLNLYDLSMCFVH